MSSMESPGRTRSAEVRGPLDRSGLVVTLCMAFLVLFGVLTVFGGALGGLFFGEQDPERAAGRAPEGTVKNSP